MPLYTWSTYCRIAVAGVSREASCPETVTGKKTPGEPGHTRDTRDTRTHKGTLTNLTRLPVKRHRGEPGHTRDTRDTRIPV
jgi:hypothetical protein